jgi:hypothetical protein
LKHHYALAMLRVRGIERVRLHADLTIMGRLALELSRARSALSRSWERGEPGSFDDDVAADVADTWNGTTAGPQLDAQALDDEVKERALAAIEPNVRRWEQESSPEDAQQRRAVLEDLRGRILHFANPS